MEPTSTAGPEVLPFTKVQALGNHFVLVWGPDAPGEDPHALAREVCPHHFAVGADGLLVVSPSTTADVRMRYFDPDGSEDMCGNGLRCVAKWSHLRGLAPSSMVAETLSGLRRCQILDDGRVRAEMGQPILETSRLPATAPVERLVDYPIEVSGRTYAVTGVSFGTTHAVIIGHDRFAPEWAEDSGAIEVHPLFPEKTTVDWVEVVGRDHIRMRPWERRLGETLACGTGACASVVATALHGMTDRTVRVEMRGGKLEVEWGEDNHVLATGRADIVYEGTYLRGGCA
jgi:diaminopimelate epimerase